ncbi:MAG TPA: hypothetical protein VNK23_15500, partial [Candidatus Dormibacteraeota bacterium]|nr:hypothetical protein [Candidatus Dormibacteraeota bacterium]
YVVYPLANLLATDQVALGDVISIDWNGAGDGLLFSKEAEGALIPMPAPDSAPAAAAAAAQSGGREISFPAALTAGAEIPLERTIASAPEPNSSTEKARKDRG